MKVSFLKYLSGMVVSATLLLVSSAAFATLPSPWLAQDVGSAGVAGSATYTNPVFTVTGSGADIWDTADSFQFAYQPAGVNCTITARVISLSNPDPWAKVGVMIRDTLASNAANAMVAVTPGNGVTFQNRSSTGNYTGFQNTTGLTAPYWVRLVRSGSVCAGYRSPDGVNWTPVGSATVNMGGNVLVGLAVTSHNNGIAGTAAFDNVTVTQSSPPIPVVSWQTNSDGLTFQMSPGTLKLQVFSPRVVRVAYSLSNSVPTNSLAVIAASTNSGWSVSSSASEVWITTAALQARVNRATGGVSFHDTNGVTLLSEPDGTGKALLATTAGGISTWRSQQQFLVSSNEAFYGLGQHGAGAMNYRGASVHLYQGNPGESAIPVLVASRGYGLLWDNPAITDVSIGQIDLTSLIWTSEAADAVDYYFMYGPALDDVIAGYRHLTGAAPMFGKWAWGFWQSKERYQTQAELLDVANTYRSLQIPLDGIVQDWQYWSGLDQTTAAGGWGSHAFEASRYPNPAQLMQTLHSNNVHMIISVWGKFDVTTNGVSISNLQHLEAVNGAYTNVVPYVYPAGQGKWYDPFSPAGRQVYWQDISNHLFSAGLDGWWLDASEPEFDMSAVQTGVGPGVKVKNAYPLMHTTAVHQGHRAASSNKRSFILTRSAYAGQQRNGTVVWSGDIVGTWDVFSNQIPAGLNFAISGVPYWNTDIGGFFFSGGPTDPAYEELFTRWFQFGAFCPMFRVHGASYAKEIWRFLPATRTNLIAFDQLRYNMLPYIHSTSLRVTSAGYTMMRPLVMDFQTETNVFGIKDQFMFGPAMMVCPVTASNATTRSVYLPSGTTWFDFWTGATNAGGQAVNAAAPIDKLPLFVRAGSILPYGPDIQYATQTNDPIELRVYRGANGSFTLYEDENDNYNYETGSYTTIPISWNESTQTLTIGARQGSFPGMMANRTFRVVWVGSGRGVALPSTTLADSVVAYSGYAVAVSPSAAPLSAPTGLIATAGINAISLVWNNSSNAVGYNIKRSTTNGGPYTMVASGLIVTNYTDSGLSSGTAYYYVVTALNVVGESANSAQAGATTPAVPPSPTGLIAVAASTNQINLAWNTSASATSYNVSRSTTDGGPYTVIASGVTATNYSDTGLIPAATYYYAVSAVNLDGVGLNSAQASATTMPPANLWAYLRFDETSGTTATDSTGHGWNGTLSGATWTSGLIGNALDLNGSSEYATLPTGVVNGLTSLTIATWVHLDAASVWSRVFDFGSGTATNMFLTASEGTRVRFALKAGGGEQQIDGTVPLPTNAWTHVAVTLSGNTGRLYVNGVQVGQNTGMTLTPSSMGATTQNWIGRSQWADPYLNGRVDDFRIYTNALSAANIAVLARVPTAPTLAGIANRTIGVGVTMSITNVAADTNVPAQTLTFSLPVAPMNAAINVNSGVLTWRPWVTQANTVNTFTVVVANSGVPSLSATQSFVVTVTNLVSPQISNLSLNAGLLTLQVHGAGGLDYQVQASTNLANWTPLFTTNSPAMPFSWSYDTTNSPLKFFRILTGPPLP